MKLNLGQLITEGPDPGLVLPGISPFQLLPQLSGVADLSIELAVSAIKKAAQHTAGLGTLRLPLSDSLGVLGRLLCTSCCSRTRRTHHTTLCSSSSIRLGGGSFWRVGFAAYYLKIGFFGQDIHDGQAPFAVVGGFGEGLDPEGCKDTEIITGRLRHFSETRLVAGTLTSGDIIERRGRE